MKKINIIRLRITPESQAKWQAYAEKEGISLSEYIRRRVDSRDHALKRTLRDYRKYKNKPEGFNPQIQSADRGGF